MILSICFFSIFLLKNELDSIMIGMNLSKGEEVYMKNHRKKCIKTMALVIACSILASKSFISYASNNLKLDVNGDGVIDKVDYLKVKANYNGKSTQYDVNSDGIIDIYDMTAISSSFNFV